MREVDEFLDQVTDTLSSLMQENDRLRREASGSSGPAPASPPASPPVAGAADRAAIQAFLEREKAFLQDLGGLVQGHAQDLKTMVRSSRSAGRAADATPAVSAAAPDPDAAQEPEPVDDGASGPPEDASPASSPGEDEAPPATPDDARTIEGQDDVQVLDVADETGSIPEIEAEAEAEAEEPIRLDEPTPTRGRREESTGSLRELFWGEE